MRKFWAYYVTHLIDALVYRAEIFVWVLNDLGPALVALVFWLAAFQSRPDIAGYSLPQMVLYYFGVMLVKNLIGIQPQYHLAEEIRDGSFSKYLLRPLNFLIYRLGGIFAWRTVRLIFFLPILLVLIYFFIHQGNVFRMPWLNFIAFLVSLFLAFLLQFLLKIVLGLTTIWLTEVGWLFFGFAVISSFFSGELIPLDLFPQNLIAINNWLPFKYMLYYPLSLGLNRVNGLEAISLGLLIQCFWCLWAYWLYRRVFKAGIKSYSAYGG